MGKLVETSTLAGEGDGTALQYSYLENPMDGGTWWAVVHGVVKSQTHLSDWITMNTLLTNEFGNLIIWMLDDKKYEKKILPSSVEHY